MCVHSLSLYHTFPVWVCVYLPGPASLTALFRKHALMTLFLQPLCLQKRSDRDLVNCVTLKFLFEFGNTGFHMHLCTE